MRTFHDLRELAGANGETFGPSRWFEVTQDNVTAYAHSVGDLLWIHTDPERAAKESEFGTTIAHGYMTLGMLPEIMRPFFRVEGISMAILVGLDKVRFHRPVRVGTRIRGTGTLTSVRVLPGGCIYGMRVSVEAEDETGPVCTADTLSRLTP
ncbi:MaoC family dehydratase [Streptomyces triticagri]|uniref:MaoC family dehydratase n=2 Tax=Streptomyces triticagri TaxID=2293568 RepID=A0A372LVU7_9ACTN|nr:MaoC family dehydratase [Streptomyces triticagri]